MGGAISIRILRMDGDAVWMRHEVQEAAISLLGADSVAPDGDVHHAGDEGTEW
jgi:hypothetical protein